MNILFKPTERIFFFFFVTRLNNTNIHNTIVNNTFCITRNKTHDNRTHDKDNSRQNGRTQQRNKQNKVTNKIAEGFIKTFIKKYDENKSNYYAIILPTSHYPKYCYEYELRTEDTLFIDNWPTIDLKTTVVCDILQSELTSNVTLHSY